MTKPMMECGHAANATGPEGNPVCVICFGIRDGATKIAEQQPELEGRRAKCPYCTREADSSPSMPFFRHQPEQEFDSFYCGCRGWN